MYKPSVILAIVGFSQLAVSADQPLYRYEADVLPYDPTAGWLNDPCEDPCTDEYVEDGHLVIKWRQADDFVFYHYWISRPGMPPPPPSLWVEWRFRSNHPKPLHADDCDAWFDVNYGEVSDLVFMYGDAVIAFNGDQGVLGLDIDEFHTYRFESPNGVDYWWSVDGFVFRTSVGFQGNDYHSLQFGGMGGCLSDWIPNMVNEWDFVRYGTISYGEEIVSSDPPSGFVDARVNPMLDRFTVTYDQPNYVYVDEISVDVAGTEPLIHEAIARASPATQATTGSCVFGPGKSSRHAKILNISSTEDKRRNTESSKSQNNTGDDSFSIPNSAFAIPVVIATRRLDNGPPETVEIVLDRPIPYNATTRFTFNDGVDVQSIEFTFAPGDTDGDGKANLSDFAAFQNCFGNSPVAGVCLPLDFNDDSAIDLLDFADFQNAFAGVP